MSNNRPPISPLERTKLVLKTAMTLGFSERYLAEQLNIPQATWRGYVRRHDIPAHVLVQCEDLLRRRIKAASGLLSEIQSYECEAAQ